MGGNESPAGALAVEARSAAKSSVVATALSGRPLSRCQARMDHLLSRLSRPSAGQGW